MAGKPNRSTGCNRTSKLSISIPGYEVTKGLAVKPLLSAPYGKYQFLTRSAPIQKFWVFNARIRATSVGFSNR
jgi:hypothetical protein